MAERSDYQVRVLTLETVDSTNRYGMDHAQELEDFTLVTADSQTAGRGRQGRLWVSPPQSNLYATWVLKNWPYPAYQATWLASLALLAAIREIVPSVKAWIKWPNDLMVGNRKLAGLLAECRAMPGQFPVIALGMGLNINLSETELEAIDSPAISLFVASGSKINRKFFIETLAIHLMRLYLIGTHSGMQSLYMEWRKHNRLLGQPVDFSDPSGRTQRSVVKDVTFSGEIVLENESGTAAWQCGDISLNKKTLPNFL